MTAVQNLFQAALDPHSEVVYFLANGALILLLVVLVICYLALESYHFIVLFLLATGLLISVNMVWANRIPTKREDEDNDKKSSKKSKKQKKKKKKKKM